MVAHNYVFTSSLAECRYIYLDKEHDNNTTTFQTGGQELKKYCSNGSQGFVRSYLNKAAPTTLAGRKWRKKGGGGDS